MKKVILNFKGEQHELTTDEEPGQGSSASPNGYATTDSGIHELDELCAKFNKGEIDLVSLVSGAWNKGYHAGTKGAQQEDNQNTNHPEFPDSWGG